MVTANIDRFESKCSVQTCSSIPTAEEVDLESIQSQFESEGEHQEHVAATAGSDDLRFR